MEILCTVLLISYNHKPYITKALESVLSQKTQYGFKIHVFDDASTDGTLDILNDFAKKYPNIIKLYVSEKNQGAQKNIWKAYESVDTKYCIMTETDDYWCDDNKLESQISALENNPDCSFCSANNLVEVIHDQYLSHKHGKPEIRPGIFKKNIITFDDINQIPCGFLTHISSRLIRTSALNLNNIKHKETVLFDASQFFYLMSQGNMYWIDQIFSVYVKTGTGTCSSALAGKRLSVYWKAMIDFNEDTAGKYWQKVAQQICLVTNFWIDLENRISGSQSMIRSQQLSKSQIVQKKLLGLKLTKIVETNDFFKVVFLGVSIVKIRK